MEKLDFKKFFKAAGRSITYYPIFSRVFQSNNVGVFLSQMFYWEGKQEDEDGWIRKPILEIEQELGLTRYEMDTIRKRLRETKVLTEVRKGVPAKLHYKFDWDRVNDLIHEYRLHEHEKPEKKGEGVERQPTIVYRMKELFLVKYKEYVGIEEYVWMEKDWNSLKLLKQTFEGRIIQKKQKADPSITAEVSDDEVFESFKKFMDILPDFYKQQRMTPTFLYSDFNAIEQRIIADGKGKTNVKQGKNAPNFGEAAKKAAQ